MSAAFKLRSAVRRADIDAIGKLVARTGVFNAEEIETARELAAESLAKGPEGSGYQFLIADGDNGIDGYTCFGPIPGTNRRFDLYWIAVDPRNQKANLGRALIAATEAAVLREGGVMLFAETSTRADYAPAHRFYGASGYTRVAEVADYYADNDGLAIYAKRLSHTKTA
jgi:ribosomal protein S18 acetylase RimI-like enzyme